VGAAEGLRPALNQIRAIDHHAHLLAGPDSSIDLAQVLSESADEAQATHVRNHPSHRRALRDLAMLFEVPPSERALAEARLDLGFEPYARRLIEAAGLEEIFVDDGFVFPGALTLAETGKLAGCPVRRVIRIETEIERAADGWPPFSDVEDRFARSIEEAARGGAVALKSIVAYRAGLDVMEPPGPERAEAGYRRWRSSGARRLTEPDVISYFVRTAFRLAQHFDLPVQIHTGFGDRDLVLHRANPSLLRPLLEDERCQDVSVVLLHCYPFVREASYLASVYVHVFFDLSMTLTFAAHRGAELVLEGLDLAPASKLLFATDASRLPELFYLAARWWRDALAGALGRLVDDNFIDQDTALAWAGLILRGNARRVYHLASRGPGD
jgi:predicted TIM-barrel fold metal-dependent hydrolase